MAKISNNFNLVDDSTMVISAKKLYDAIIKYAPYDKIRQAVYISRVEGRKTSRFITVSINMNEETGGAPFARAFDIGSGIHGERRRKYKILPRDGTSFLQFAGTNKFSGQIIRTKEVEHPGVRGVGYTKKAIDEVRPEIRSEVAKDVKENLRLYLRAQFSSLGTVK